MNKALANPRVHQLLSEAARGLSGGQTVKAKKLCEEAVRLAPSSADAHMLLADVLASRSETDLARKHYVKATESDQYHFGAWLNYGVFLKENDEFRSAILAFKNAVLIEPKSSLAQYNLARALLQVGEYREAADVFTRFVKMEPRFGEGFHSLSVAEELAGNYDTAITNARKAIQLNPQFASAYLQIGGLYQTMGDFDKAEEFLRKGMQVAPEAKTSFEALLTVNTVRGTSDEDETLSQIREALAKGNLEQTGRAHFLFAGGKILDGRKEYDEAFSYYSEANAIRDGAIRDTFDDQTDTWNRVVSYFDEDFMQSWPHKGNETEQPIFIVGMPRSGTTLTEQILATHPRVYGAGELVHLKTATNDTVRDLRVGYPEFFDQLSQEDLLKFADRYISRYPQEARGFDRITDKQPLNLIHLGTLSLLFPNAKFIFCRRNAIDTCLSCFMQNFLSHVWFAFNQEKLALHYRMHIDTMNHWSELMPGRIHEVRYEDLTTDPEPHIRALLEHCDLEWDDACLEFHKTDRGVRTASKWQVRQPMYTSSVEKWRHYEKHLGPLIEGLGEIAET